MLLRFVALVAAFVTVTLVPLVAEEEEDRNHPLVFLKVTEVRAEQSLNARLPMLCTLLGIMIDFNEVHLPNAYCSIVVTEDGIVTDVKLLQP